MAEAVRGDSERMASLNQTEYKGTGFFDIAAKKKVNETLGRTEGLSGSGGENTTR